ncbi:flagellar assembly protein FliH [bacterium]|nr:flagellar assembly protein FliH [bacterium]
MFRVLSDEESRKVTRWRAPEIAPGSAVVANTRQQARPAHAPDDEDVRSLLGSKSLKPAKIEGSCAPPQLQPINDHDVFANLAVADMHHAPVIDESKEAAESDSVVRAAMASPDMLQTSYDEGYARGFAEGNTALQQHSIKELTQIISAIADASTHQDETDLEEAVVSLSLDIARLVIRREVQIDDRLMSGIVQAGLEQLPGGTRNQQYVKLHPLDANVVRRHVSDNADVQIIDDPALERGACRIQSGASVIHAGIDDWLNNVAVQLGLEDEQSMQADDLVDKQSMQIADASEQSVMTEKSERVPPDE